MGTDQGRGEHEFAIGVKKKIQPRNDVYDGGRPYRLPATQDVQIGREGDFVAEVEGEARVFTGKVPAAEIFDQMLDGFDAHFVSDGVICLRSVGFVRSI